MVGVFGMDPASMYHRVACQATKALIHTSIMGGVLGVIVKSMCIKELLQRKSR